MAGAASNDFGYNAAMSESVPQLVARLAESLKAVGHSIATAESCTGGLIAKTCTDIAGSSDWFERGFVTYSNSAKAEMLAVPASIIEDYGAVSEPVATAMASGALTHSAAEFAVAVTGVAGPGGGNVDKPVGTVWISVAGPGRVEARLFHFDGNRAAVREASLEQSLTMLLELVDDKTD